MSGLDTRISMLAKVLNTSTQEPGSTRSRTLHELRYNLRPLSDAVHTGFGQEVRPEVPDYPVGGPSSTTPPEPSTSTEYKSPWQRVKQAIEEKKELKPRSISPWKKLEQKILNVVPAGKPKTGARQGSDQEALLSPGNWTPFRGPHEPGFKDIEPLNMPDSEKTESESQIKTISTQTDNETEDVGSSSKSIKKKKKKKKKGKDEEPPPVKILIGKSYQPALVEAHAWDDGASKSATMPKKKVRIEASSPEHVSRKDGKIGQSSGMRRSRSTGNLNSESRTGGTNNKGNKNANKSVRRQSLSPVRKRKTIIVREDEQIKADIKKKTVQGGKQATQTETPRQRKRKEALNMGDKDTKSHRDEAAEKKSDSIKKLAETKDSAKMKEQTSKSNEQRKADAIQKSNRQTIRDRSTRREKQSSTAGTTTISVEIEGPSRETDGKPAHKQNGDVILTIGTDSEEDGSEAEEEGMKEGIPKAKSDEALQIIKEEAADEIELQRMREKSTKEQEEGNIEDGIPPGNEEYDALEELLRMAGGDEEAPDGMDPDMVARVEEQIFKKIRFYKEVIDQVREKPWPLKKKVTLLKEAKEYTAKFEGKLSKAGGPGQLQRIKVAWAKFAREMSNYMAVLVPWEGKIRSIESYFGSVVASYFTFLRWVFGINVIQALIIGVVIIMPEVLWGPDWGSVNYKSVPENETFSAANLKTLWDFDGYAKTSPLFYGYYSNIKRYDSGYRMPLGYLFGNLMVFAYSFVTILRQIAANSKDDKAADKDDNFTFSWKTFVSWDYMIGNNETAKNKFKAIVIAVRESITEAKEKKKKIGKKLKFFRFLANVAVLCVLASSTYAIALTVERSIEFEERAKLQGPDSVSWWETNEISVVMSLATTLFPILFDIIALMEDYHPRIALQWSLGRIMVLYLLNLYTLYIALYQKIQTIQEEATTLNDTFYANLNMSLIVPCTITTEDPVQLNETGEVYQTSVSPEFYNESLLDLPCGIPDYIPDVTCWETMVGQELFKLTVFDFVTAIGVIYASEFFRALYIRIFNSCWCWDLEKYFPAYAEFSLAENLLHLIYNQGMIWMGTLFSPGLPAFNLFKLLCLFYVRAWSVMVCNVPHERIFKAGSDNFYLAMLLFMLYVVMIPIAFAMVTIQPSRNCGPFRDIDFMYLALTEWMEEVFSSGVNGVFNYVSSPGALIPIFILIFLLLYYLNSSNDALQGTVLDLKKQLQYERTEGKKKVFNMAGGAGKDTKDKSSNRDDASSVTAKRSAGWKSLQAVQKVGVFRKPGSINNLSTASPMIHRSASKTSLISDDSMDSGQGARFVNVVKEALATANTGGNQPISKDPGTATGNSLTNLQRGGQFNMNTLATATQFLAKLRRGQAMKPSTNANSAM